MFHETFQTNCPENGEKTYAHNPCMSVRPNFLLKSTLIAKYQPFRMGQSLIDLSINELHSLCKLLKC